MNKFKYRINSNLIRNKLKCKSFKEFILEAKVETADDEGLVVSTNKVDQLKSWLKSKGWIKKILRIYFDQNKGLLLVDPLL